MRIVLTFEESARSDLMCGSVWVLEPQRPTDGEVVLLQAGLSRTSLKASP